MNSAEFETLANGAGALLLKAGFTMSDQRGPDQAAFGDQIVEFRRRNLTVSATLDRGLAFLTLSCVGIDGRRDLGLWEACLERRLPSLEVRDFHQDLDWLLLRLPDLEALVDRGIPELEDCLRSNGTWRFNTRRELGLMSAPTEE